MADGRARAEPQISANDLALYLVSTDVGKLGIIRRNKYPSKHIVTHYQEAKKWLVKFLTGDVRDKAILAQGIDYFEHLISDSSTIPSKKEDAKRSKVALEAFYGAYNALELTKLTFRPAPRLAPLMIKGVRVSINLDLLTAMPVKGVDYQGGAIMRLTLPADDTDSAQNKRDDMGEHTATLAYMQVQDKQPGQGEPLPRICMAVDVQHQAKYEAKAGASRRRSNIEAACTMIKSTWGSV